MDINSCRSYATRENLKKNLAKLGLDKHRPIIVRNDQGRWTAIFGYTLSGYPNPATIAHMGYMVIN